MFIEALFIIAMETDKMPPTDNGIKKMLHLYTIIMAVSFVGLVHNDWPHISMHVARKHIVTGNTWIRKATHLMAME
jgi:hypothetical protein